MNCTVCEKEFEPRSTRSKTCGSKECAQIHRKNVSKKTSGHKSPDADLTSEDVTMRNKFLLRKAA